MVTCGGFWLTGYAAAFSLVEPRNGLGATTDLVPFEAALAVDVPVGAGVVAVVAEVVAATVATDGTKAAIGAVAVEEEEEEEDAAGLAMKVFNARDEWDGRMLTC